MQLQQEMYLKEEEIGGKERTTEGSAGAEMLLQALV